jgi:hypothetical protein
LQPAVVPRINKLESIQHFPTELKLCRNEHDTDNEKYYISDMRGIDDTLQIILMQMIFYMKVFRKNIIHKIILRPAITAPSQETDSV